MYKTFLRRNEEKSRKKKREMSTFEERSQKRGEMRVFEDPWEP